MPKNPADWLPQLFTKAEGTVREATTKKFSEFTKVEDGEGVQLVGLKGNSNIRVDVNDLTVEIPEPDEITTSTVMLENEDVLRNSKGQFMSIEGMDTLTTQKDANRYLNEKIVEAQDSITEVSEALDDVTAQVDDVTAQVSEGLEGQQLLEDKVTALEGAVGEHSFVFEGVSQNPREGQFILRDENQLNTNMLSQGKAIVFSPVDRAGNTVAWSRVGVGDVLRFSDVAMQTDEIRITGQITDSSFFYEKISGEQDRLSEYPYDFVLLSSFDPTGLATVDYVDARVNSKIGRNNIWTLGQDAPWELRQKDTSNSEKKFINIYDGVMKLSHVNTPTSAMDAANRLYVDQEIAKVTANLSAPRPAQFSWKWAGESSNAPGTSTFCKNSSRWKFNLKTFNGIEISKPDAKHWNTSQLIEMSIWRTDGAANKWKMIKHLEIDEVDWGKEYSGNTWIEFHQKWQSNTLKLIEGHEYFVTVGGFF